MTEKEFYVLAEEILVKLADDIEEMDKDAVLEVEYMDGILNIVIEETSQTYVINKHSASQKIWYSSPLTGANYFAYDASSQKWLDDKNEELRQTLFLELSQIIHIEK